MYDYMKMFLTRKGPESVQDMENGFRELESFCRAHADIYLYGTGELGRLYLALVEKIGIVAKGFVATKKESPSKIKGIPVYDLAEIEKSFSSSTGVILSMPQKEQRILAPALPEELDLFHTTDVAVQLIYDLEILRPLFEKMEREASGFGDIGLKSQWDHLQHTFSMVHDEEMFHRTLLVNDCYYEGQIHDNIKSIGGLRDTAIVMQGPIRKEFGYTMETLRFYRALYPNAPIVYSTWKGEADDAFRKNCKDLGIDLLESDMPNDPGFRNTNLQITSSRIGIEFAQSERKAAYALKCRSDQRINMPYFLIYFRNLVELHPPKDDTLEKRLVFMNSGDFYVSAFYMGDQTTFGTVPDMLKLYHDREEKLLDKEDFAFSAEIFIMRTFFKKYIGPVSQEDGPMQFIRFLRDYIIFANSAALKIQHPKYYWSRHRFADVSDETTSLGYENWLGYVLPCQSVDYVEYDLGGKPIRLNVR